MFQLRQLKMYLILLTISLVIFIPQPEMKQTSMISASDESTETLVQEVQTDSTLENKIDDILKDERLDGTVTGVSVRHADTGEMLYSHEGDKRLRPASNMKLLTSAAALDVLGPDYQFETEVLTDGQVNGIVLHGDVYLKGKGDPTLMKEDLDQFAKDLQKQGIKKVKGNIIGDDVWYDDIRLSQDLNWSDEPFYTGAQVSALTLSPNDDYDAGTVIVDVNPAEKKGDKATVSLTPHTDYVTIVNKTKTVAADKANDISIERDHGSNEIIIEGEIPLEGTRSRSWVSIWEPTGYAVNVFKKALEDQGITFAGQVAEDIGETPSDAKVLTSKKSIPLEDLLIPFMKLSNNGHGETLVKEMGQLEHQEGSWDKGLDVMEETLKELGMDSSTLQLRDGSGMSHKNMVTSDELSNLLFQVQDKSWYPIYETALPVAGVDERLVGGSLRYRLLDPATKENVIAKTGSISGVSTLSGYVTSADGEDLIFSIMINSYLEGPVTSIEDAIAIILAEHEFD